jgi:hypothetical protein
MAYSGTTCAVIDMHAKGGDNRIPIPDTGRYMRQNAHSPVPANSERKQLAGFHLSIHWSYDTNDGIYPHHNTRFIEQQCLWFVRRGMPKKQDENENGQESKSFYKTHSVATSTTSIFESDLLLMMFNGSRMSPELSSYLHALSPNYKCIDDWLGYRVYDEERFKTMNLRQFLRLEQKKSRPASGCYDRDHSMGRDDSHLILHATKSCTDGSHSSRMEKNCHCLGTSRIQYFSDAEVAKMAADKLAEIKRAELAVIKRAERAEKKAVEVVASCQ